MNYPALLGLTASLRVGLPASTTRFADTGVSTGVQSPQAFLRSVSLLVARRGDSVGQRTLLVAFERYPCPSASQGASRSEWNDERIEADRSERPS